MQSNNNAGPSDGNVKSVKHAHTAAVNTRRRSSTAAKPSARTTRGSLKSTCTAIPHKGAKEKKASTTTLATITRAGSNASASKKRKLSRQSSSSRSPLKRSATRPPRSLRRQTRAPVAADDVGTAVLTPEAETPLSRKRRDEITREEYRAQKAVPSTVQLSSSDAFSPTSLSRPVSKEKPRHPHDQAPHPRTESQSQSQLQGRYSSSSGDVTQDMMANIIHVPAPRPHDSCSTVNAGSGHDCMSRTGSSRPSVGASPTSSVHLCASSSANDTHSSLAQMFLTPMNTSFSTSQQPGFMVPQFDYHSASWRSGPPNTSNAAAAAVMMGGGGRLGRNRNSSSSNGSERKRLSASRNSSSSSYAAPQTAGTNAGNELWNADGGTTCSPPPQLPWQQQLHSPIQPWPRQRRPTFPTKPTVHASGPPPTTTTARDTGRLFSPPLASPSADLSTRPSQQHLLHPLYHQQQRQRSPREEMIAVLPLHRGSDSVSTTNTSLFMTTSTDNFSVPLTPPPPPPLMSALAPAAPSPMSMDGRRKDAMESVGAPATAANTPRSRPRLPTPPPMNVTPAASLPLALENDEESAGDGACDTNSRMSLRRQSWNLESDWSPPFDSSVTSFSLAQLPNPTAERTSPRSTESTNSVTRTAAGTTGMASDGFSDSDREAGEDLPPNGGWQRRSTHFRRASRPPTAATTAVASLGNSRTAVISDASDAQQQQSGAFHENESSCSNASAFTTSFASMRTSVFDLPPPPPPAPPEELHLGVSSDTNTKTRAGDDAGGYEQSFRDSRYGNFLLDDMTVPPLSSDRQNRQCSNSASASDFSVRQASITSFIKNSGSASFNGAGDGSGRGSSSEANNSSGHPSHNTRLSRQDSFFSSSHVSLARAAPFMLVSPKSVAPPPPATGSAAVVLNPPIAETSTPPAVDSLSSVEKQHPDTAVAPPPWPPEHFEERQPAETTNVEGIHGKDASLGAAVPLEPIPIPPSIMRREEAQTTQNKLSMATATAAAAPRQEQVAHTTPYLEPKSPEDLFTSMSLKPSKSTYSESDVDDDASGSSPHRTTRSPSTATAAPAAPATLADVSITPLPKVLSLVAHEAERSPPPHSFKDESMSARQQELAQSFRNRIQVGVRAPRRKSTVQRVSSNSRNAQQRRGNSSTGGRTGDAPRSSRNNGGSNNKARRRGPGRGSNSGSGGNGHASDTIVGTFIAAAMLSLAYAKLMRPVVACRARHHFAEVVAPRQAYVIQCAWRRHQQRRRIGEREAVRLLVPWVQLHLHRRRKIKKVSALLLQRVFRGQRDRSFHHFLYRQMQYNRALEVVARAVRARKARKVLESLQLQRDERLLVLEWYVQGLLQVMRNEQLAWSVLVQEASAVLRVRPNVTKQEWVTGVAAVSGMRLCPSNSTWAAAESAKSVRSPPPISGAGAKLAFGGSPPSSRVERMRQEVVTIMLLESSAYLQTSLDAREASYKTDGELGTEPGSKATRCLTHSSAPSTLPCVTLESSPMGAGEEQHDASKPPAAVLDADAEGSVTSSRKGSLRGAEAVDLPETTDDDVMNAYLELLLCTEATERVELERRLASQHHDILYQYALVNKAIFYTVTERRTMPLVFAPLLLSLPSLSLMRQAVQLFNAERAARCQIIGLYDSMPLQCLRRPLLNPVAEQRHGNLVQLVDKAANPWFDAEQSERRLYREWAVYQGRMGGGGAGGGGSMGMASTSKLNNSPRTSYPATFYASSSMSVAPDDAALWNSQSGSITPAPSTLLVGPHSKETSVLVAASNATAALNVGSATPRPSPANGSVGIRVRMNISAHGQPGLSPSHSAPSFAGVPIGADEFGCIQHGDTKSKTAVPCPRRRLRGPPLPLLRSMAPATTTAANSSLSSASAAKVRVKPRRGASFRSSLNASATNGGLSYRSNAESGREEMTATTTTNIITNAAVSTRWPPAATHVPSALLLAPTPTREAAPTFPLVGTSYEDSARRSEVAGCVHTNGLIGRLGNSRRSADKRFSEDADGRPLGGNDNLRLLSFTDYLEDGDGKPISMSGVNPLTWGDRRTTAAPPLLSSSIPRQRHSAEAMDGAAAPPGGSSPSAGRAAARLRESADPLLYPSLRGEANRTSRMAAKDDGEDGVVERWKKTQRSAPKRTARTPPLPDASGPPSQWGDDLPSKETSFSFPSSTSGASSVEESNDLSGSSRRLASPGAHAPRRPPTPPPRRCYDTQAGAAPAPMPDISVAEAAASAARLQKVNFSQLRGRSLCGSKLDSKGDVGRPGGTNAALSVAAKGLPLAVANVVPFAGAAAMTTANATATRRASAFEEGEQATAAAGGASSTLPPLQEYHLQHRSHAMTM